MGPENDDLTEIDVATLPSDSLGGNDMPMSIGGDEDDLVIDFIDEATSDDASVQNEADSGDYSAEEMADESYEAQEAVNRARQERADLERKYLAQQEDLERRLVESEKQKIEVQRDSFRLALDGIDVRINSATEALAYARQEDDYASQTKLEADLAEMRQIKQNIQANQQHLGDPAELDRQFQAHIERRRNDYAAKGSDDVQGLNPKANAWIKKNSWFNSNKTAQKSVMAVNDALVQEGYDPNSDEFFGELSRRVAKRHGDLKVQDLGGRTAGNAAGQAATKPRNDQGQFVRQNASPPVASARATTTQQQGQRQGKRTVQLDSSDRAMLRALGQQDNPDAIKRFAREKMNRLSKEQRR